MDDLQRIKDTHESQMEQLRNGKMIMYSVHPKDVQILIEQAEQVDKLKEDKRKFMKWWQSEARLADKYMNQNKRYLSLINAMQQILKDAIHSLDVGEKVQGLEYGVEMANEALESESE